MVDLVTDLLNNWPLALGAFWLFPLFFAAKFIRLGQLGIYGRGLPLFSSKRRWRKATGLAFSWLLIMTGFSIIAGFLYWLLHAVF